MPKQKKKGNNSNQRSHKPKPKTNPLSPEEQKMQKKIDAFDAGSNPYTNSINKKLRNVNKKLAKIEALESKKPDELNADQKNSIQRKPELLAELERYQGIQKDLIKIYFETTDGESPANGEKKEEEEEENVESFEGGVSRLCKLHVVTRLPCFERASESTAQVLGSLEGNPSLSDVPLSRELLFNIKNFSNALSGYLVNETVHEAVASSTNLAMKYIEASDEVAPNTELSFRTINKVIDAIAESWTN